MEATGPATFWITRFCIQRAVGFIYLIAFFVAANQFRALLGENGLLPVPIFLKRVSFWDAPSLFWLNPSDRFFTLVAWAGVFLSILAVTGISDRFGMAFSVTVWFLLWLFYLSFVNVGQTFYSFGWESMLLEAGFLAIFLGSSDTHPPALVIWLYRWMLFRLMFGAGLIKLRGDPCWRDLTCLIYHYETQPVPNPLSWYWHRLPVWVHKSGTLFTHFVELLVPWGYFAPRVLCTAAGLVSILFQVSLIISGNLSFLNYLTLVLTIPCFDDAFLSKFIPMAQPSVEPMSLARRGILGALFTLVLVLSIAPTLNLISSRQIMNTSFEPFHLVNTYGAFGSITKQRFEVVLNGTEDLVITPATRWKEYGFKCKPGRTDRPPCLMSPYHYRLDWLMWFAAMSDYRYHPWIVNLVAKLLLGDAKTLKLMAHNPFPKNPPTFVKADLYLYRFTDPRERKETGQWWHRTRIESYLPPLSLSDPDFKEILRKHDWL